VKKQMTHSNKDLVNLREAIAKHDWYECEETMKRLVENLSPREAVRLSVKQVSLFLPVFEQYHPNITGPRKMLSLLASGDPIDETSSFPELSNNYSSPGSSGFLRAIALVDNASQSQHDPHSCFTKVGRAIANAIGSRRLEYWARKFPADWEIAHRSEIGEENLPSIQSDYLREPEVEKYTEGMWSAVADEIEKLLNV
jgi:hypothetical protein